MHKIRLNAECRTDLSERGARKDGRAGVRSDWRLAQKREQDFCPTERERKVLPVE